MTGKVSVISTTVTDQVGTLNRTVYALRVVFTSLAYGGLLCGEIDLNKSLCIIVVLNTNPSDNERLVFYA